MEGPRCTADADCDDGLVCNGVERCGTASERCVRGIPLDCDDGVSCTHDMCVEPDGACSSTPNDSLCGGDARCALGSGCIVSCGPGITCDPVAPGCGCASDEACTLNTGVPECGAAGTSLHGEVCDGTTSCVAGTQCYSLDVLYDPPRQSVCRTLCHDDSDCPSGARCNGPVGSDDTRACTQPCDLANDATCPPGTACHPLTFLGSIYADCAVLGDSPRGGTCSTTNDCQAGLLCIDTEASGRRCLDFCRTNSDCLGSESCYFLTVPLIIRRIEYGICF